MSVRASKVVTTPLIPLALLLACGDSTGATGHASASSSGEATSSGPGAPTTSSTAGATVGETVGETAGETTGSGSDSATSTPTTGEAPGTTSTTTATTGDGTTSTTGEGTTGEGTTGGPVEPDECVESVDGWCWVYPLPHGNSLLDAWSDGAGRVWVAGEGNTLMWHDGQAWHTRAADDTAGLRGVWGAAPDDAWAVGDGGIILHYDGVAWIEVTSPAKKTLRAVWGSGPNDVYAGGDGGALFHFDGVDWAAYNPGLAIGDVTSIWGLGADDVWVGTTGFGGVTIHWDGVAWKYRPVDVQGSARAVWGRAKDDVYAALDQTVVLAHWTGDPIWDKVDYPGAQPMYSVVGDETRLWAGGRGMMLHHDGQAWSEVAAFKTTEIYGLERVEDEILAVGGRGVIGRLQGGAWGFEAGDPAVFGTSFGSVHGYSADDVWFGGTRLAHWDGVAVKFVDLGVKNLVLGALAGADGELWAIGNEIGSRAVWHHDGGETWSKVLPLPDMTATTLWAVDATTLWIGGDYAKGDILRWDGQKLDLFPIPGATFSVVKFHGLAGDDLWAVGNEERLLHWDGVSWTIVHQAMNGDYLQGVWELAPNDVWVGGSSGKIYHWNGVDWTPQKLNNWGFNDLWATAPDDIWAVGGLQASHGVIFHYDGVAWSEVASGSGKPLYSLWGVDGMVWAVGAQNSVLVHQ